MARFKLTDCGTIICDEGEMYVDDFLNQLKNQNGVFRRYLGRYRYSLDEFYFDSKNKKFKIRMSYKDDWDSNEISCSIKLSDKQKSLIEAGKPSQEVLKLLAFIEEEKYKKRLEKINDKFKESGNLPTDPEEVLLYKEYLQRKMKEVAAEIVKSSISVATPVVLATAAFLFTYNFAPTSSIGDAIFSSVLVSTVTVASYCSVVSIFFDKRPFPIKTLRMSLEERELLEEKIRCLNKSNNELEQNVLKSEASVISEETAVNDEVMISENIFLKEVELVKNAILRLPQNERGKYGLSLYRILAEYRDDVQSFLDKDKSKIDLSTPNSIYQINMDSLPKLYSLASSVEIRLMEITENNGIIEEIDKTEESLASLGFQDGYTDGYTDELREDGQYAIVM